MNTVRLTNIYTDIESCMGIQALSHECRVLLDLYEAGHMQPTHLLARSRASKAKFYQVLGDLEFRKVVTSHASSADPRCRHYLLTEESRLAVDALLSKLVSWVSSRNASIDMGKGFIRSIYEEAREAIGVKIFSVEYQILLMIYDDIELSAADLFTSVDTSSSTFFNRLEKLHNNSIISKVKKDLDGRKVRYVLTSVTRSFLDGKHNDLLSWIKSLHSNMKSFITTNKENGHNELDKSWSSLINVDGDFYKFGTSAVSKDYNNKILCK